MVKRIYCIYVVRFTLLSKVDPIVNKSIFSTVYEIYIQIIKCFYTSTFVIVSQISEKITGHVYIAYELVVVVEMFVFKRVHS